MRGEAEDRGNIFHLKEVEVTEDVTLGRPTAPAESLSAALIQLRSVLTYLDLPSGTGEFTYADLSRKEGKSGKWIADITKKHAYINIIANTLQTTVSSIERDKERARLLEQLSGFDMPLAYLTGRDGVRR